MGQKLDPAACVENAINTGDISSLTNETDEVLKKEYARQYFLLTGINLSGVDPNSYGFSIQELVDRNKINLIPLISKRDCCIHPDWSLRKQNEKCSSISLVGLKINNIEGLSEKIPGAATLQSLDLRYNHITSIPRTSFKGMIGLRGLSLSFNHIPSIDEHAFEDLIHLEVMHLAYNRLATIAPETFKNLTTLKILDLRNNNLGDISPEMFKKSHSLPQKIEVIV